MLAIRQVQLPYTLNALYGANEVSPKRSWSKQVVPTPADGLSRVAPKPGVIETSSLLVSKCSLVSTHHVHTWHLASAIKRVVACWYV